VGEPPAAQEVRERQRDRHEPRARGAAQIQNLLEPDRKVEVLREMESKRDLLVEIDEKGDQKNP